MNSSFESLGLLPELVRAVQDEGYTAPTPIQMQAIPSILQGRDILAAAQTGTGKTAGFALPLLQRLASNAHRPAPKSVRALILTPTRELAAQVESAIRTYGKHLKLSTTVVFGGVGMQPQVDRLKRGIDVLVATPGRLLDHAQQHTVDLSKVEILVLDEADRMLDMGFLPDIKRVLKLLPAKKQNLLFSATFSDEIRALATGLIHNPITVEVARRNAPADIVAQSAYMVAKERKRELLRDLIADGKWQQVLVFTRMKHGANRLAEQLNKDGLAAAAIHGNKSQNARTKALAEFKSNTVRVLVATDIAARGLDIEGLPHVVNYELPNVPEDYVHRIGRTGRAGVPGHAVSLVSADEATYLRDIERLLKKSIERLPLPADFATRAPSAQLPSVEPSVRVERPQRPRRSQPSPRQGERRAEGQRRTPTARPKVQTSQPARHRGANPARPPHEPKHEVQRDSRTGAPAPARTETPKPRRQEPLSASRRRDREEPNTVRSNLPPHLQGAFRRVR